MNHGDQAEAWRLPRIRGLLKGLPGPLGNGEIRVWVNADGMNSMPDHVFALIAGAAILSKRCTPGGFEEDVPADAVELMAKLSETDEINAAGILTWLMSTTMVYGGHGRYEEPKARDVAKALIRLLGPGARWWTNIGSWTFTPARAWSPVTQHTMDAVVVGTGAGVIVTILAVDDD